MLTEYDLIITPSESFAGLDDSECNFPSHTALEINFNLVTDEILNEEHSKIYVFSFVSLLLCIAVCYYSS